MPKIQTYELTEIPLSLNDMLIGTEIGGPIPFATKNFSLGQLYDFFQEETGVVNLQYVLNNGNSATQNMTIVGVISATTLTTETIELVGRFFDSTGSEGSAGQVLKSTGAETIWGDPDQIYVSVTRGELFVLIDDSLIIPGATYFINDRNYFLTGLTSNQVSIEGSRKMQVPLTYLDGAEIGGVVWHGVFYPDIEALSIGDKVIWGGVVWVSKTGTSAELPNSDISLSSLEWDLSVSDGDYIYKSFDIIYDLQNDWVSQQRDNFNNVVGISFATAQDLELVYNPVDITDWNMYTSSPLNKFGNNTVFQGFFNNRAYLYNNYVTAEIKQNTGKSLFQYVNIYDNNCNLGGGIAHNRATVIGFNNLSNGCIYNYLDQIYGNNCQFISTNSGSSVSFNDMQNSSIVGNETLTIEYNKCFDINSNTGDYILNNICTGVISNNATATISYNSNKGGIYSNTSNVTAISNNSNIGNISNNSNVGSISYNVNLGQVANNSNNGVISFNSNQGQIFLNSNDGGISYNANSGQVSQNSNTGLIEYNINNGNIFGNTNIDRIYNNNNNGKINSNSNNGQITFNSNNGSIESNSNLSSIEANSNGSYISNNNNTGTISNNSNAGFIYGITDTTTDIFWNNNNGGISYSVIGVISDPQVNK